MVKPTSGDLACSVRHQGKTCLPLPAFTYLILRLCLREARLASYSVADDDLELLILLHQPLERWDCRHAWKPCLVSMVLGIKLSV